MAFDLQGGPATFQRLIDKVLEPCKAFARAYLDDIVIFSDSWEEHLVHVEKTLECIQKAGLKIHPRKIKMTQNEVPYLGDRIGNGLIARLERKIPAVQAFTLPLS